MFFFQTLPTAATGVSEKFDNYYRKSKSLCFIIFSWYIYVTHYGRYTILLKMSMESDYNNKVSFTFDS